MKTYKRAQSTLNYEYNLLKNHNKHPNPNNITVERINKDKFVESFLITGEHIETSMVDIYFGKQGNVIGITKSHENGDIYENLELK